MLASEISEPMRALETLLLVSKASWKYDWRPVMTLSIDSEGTLDAVDELR